MGHLAVLRVHLAYKPYWILGLYKLYHLHVFLTIEKADDVPKFVAPAFKFIYTIRPAVVVCPAIAGAGNFER